MIQSLTQPTSRQQKTTSESNTALKITQFSLKIPREFYYRASLYPTHNNTYLIIQDRYMNKKLTHVSSLGKVLGNLDFSSQVAQIQLLDDTHALILHYRTQDQYFTISTWNLQNHTFTQVHYNSYKKMRNVRFCAFREGSLVAVIIQTYQKSNKDQQNINYHIVYYKYPLQQYDKPYHQHILIIQKYNKILSANHKSMIAFVFDAYQYQPEQNWEKICFVTYSIEEGQRQYTIRPQIQCPLYFNLLIKDIWQVRPQLFYLNIKKQINARIQYEYDLLYEFEQNIKAIEHTYSFYLELLPTGNAELRKTKYQIAQDHRVQFGGNFRCLDCRVWQPNNMYEYLTMTKKSCWDYQSTLLPRYYIDADSQTILARHHINNQSKKQYEQISHPAYEDNLQVIANRTCTQDGTQFTITRVELGELRFGGRFIVVFMMLCLVEEGCEEDLLCSVADICGV